MPGMHLRGIAAGRLGKGAKRSSKAPDKRKQLFHRVNLYRKNRKSKGRKTHVISALCMNTKAYLSLSGYASLLQTQPILQSKNSYIDPYIHNPAAMKYVLLLLLATPQLLFSQFNPVTEETYSSAEGAISRILNFYGDTITQVHYYWDTEEGTWEKQYRYKRTQGLARTQTTESWDTLSGQWKKVSRNDRVFSEQGCETENTSYTSSGDNSWQPTFRTQLTLASPASTACAPSEFRTYTHTNNGNFSLNGRTRFQYDSQGRILEFINESTLNGGVSWEPNQKKNWNYSDTLETSDEYAYANGIWNLYYQERKTSDSQGRIVRELGDYVESNFNDHLLLRFYDAGGDTTQIVRTFSRQQAAPWEKQSLVVLRNQVIGNLRYIYNYNAYWDTSLLIWNNIMETEQSLNLQGDLLSSRTSYRTFIPGFGWSTQESVLNYDYIESCDGIKSGVNVIDALSGAPLYSYSYRYLNTPDCEEAEVLTLSPNPARDLLFVQSGLLGTDGTRIEIFDLSGRQKTEVLITYTSSIAEIDVSALTPGLYLLRIRQGDVLATEKFYKNP
ncbi:MAG: T9SS C-terminal target domain-containing protein [Bacteroidetes bacterium]|nr:MAG: T9SS C-terminal target domain-containing protein [Bacteroidota bacterium]